VTFDADAFPPTVGRARTAAAEPPPEQPPPPAGPRPIAIVYPSRTNGSGHIVTVNAAGTLACTCEAATHDRACWAVKAARPIMLQE
jgi:hypothetical protein